MTYKVCQLEEIIETMVKQMKSVEKEITEINKRDKSVDFVDNVEQENNGCKTHSNQSVETMVMTD